MSATIRNLAKGALLAGILSVTSAGEPIRLPSDYKSHTLYATVENETGNMIRDMYADDAIVAAVKAHRPLPAGGVITMPMYHLKHDDAGAAIRDGAGHFVRAEMFKIFVMQKAAEDAGWMFAAFSAAGEPDEPRDTSVCSHRHGGPDAKDGLFTMPQLLKLAP